jgi:hypothetical protein
MRARCPLRWTTTTRCAQLSECTFVAHPPLLPMVLPSPVLRLAVPIERGHHRGLLRHPSLVGTSSCAACQALVTRLAVLIERGHHRGFKP